MHYTTETLFASCCREFVCQLATCGYMRTVLQLQTFLRFCQKTRHHVVRGDTKAQDALSEDAVYYIIRIIQQKLYESSCTNFQLVDTFLQLQTFLRFCQKTRQHVVRGDIKTTNPGSFFGKK